MTAFIKKFFDITFWKFILVGVANTLFGTGIMFVFYNVLGLSYWVSSASNYILGSILSYFLNKYFTFRSTERSPAYILRFVINITLCYLIAYGAAQPLIRMLFAGLSAAWQDNIAMLAGMCIFVALNYCGQRFFVFKADSPAEENQP